MILIADILQEILSTNLIAPSTSELAKELGYKGRTSLYRVRYGESTEKAVAEVCQRLESVLGITREALLQMGSTISNTTKFTSLMKHEMNTSHPDWQFQALLAFVGKDYSHFSPRFRTEELSSIVKLSEDDPEAFFAMLAYFYVKSRRCQFYVKGIPYKEQCARLMEELGERLAAIYPENTMATNLVYCYSKSTVFDSESHILWNLVRSMASMLECFANPRKSIESVDDMLLLAGTGNRIYWRADRNNLLLAAVVHGRRPGSGFYEVFSVDRSGKAIENICSIYLLSENIVSVTDKLTKTSQLGIYSWDNRLLTFSWEAPEDNPTGAGNIWKRLDTDR